ADSASVTIASSGVFDLGGNTETIHVLNMTAGQISGSGGTLVLGDDVVINAAAAVSATIAPTGNLGGGTRTFTVADRAAVRDLVVSGNIMNGSLNKAGAGRMDVKTVRVGSGNLTISAGLLRLLDDSTAAGVSVVNVLSIAAGGKLDLRDNKLISHGSPVGTLSGAAYTDVTGRIAAGRGGGSRNGSTGISTSETTATTGRLT